MGLSEYRRKRDFAKTPEPEPSKAPGSDVRLFTVQKHSATSLHYDLRLRVGDVLKSWAVPKGPSFDPREKRLAIEVEDHPIDYAEFEGVIPEDQYGGGTVMLWDRGRWLPEGDAAKGLKDGMLKFRLEGERLKGRWMLVRTKRGDKHPQWLLVKERDSEASAGVHAETFATSVASGRTMDEIAAGAKPRAAARDAKEGPKASALKGARAGPMPSRIKPQLASPADVAPEGDDWFHEVKFDGYRLLIFRRGDSVKIQSRNGLDWTAKLPDLAAAVGERLRVDAVIDGEAVVLDTRGISNFQALQNAIHSRRAKSIVFFAFDLPWCDGQDLMKSPLEQRRALLSELIGSRQEGRLRFSEHIAGNGPEAFDRVCQGGLEGIVSKRRGSVYSQTRTPAWVKVKCFNQQEFVVGGFSEPEGAREQFGAMLLGYYDDDGSLRFAGKVGTGFSAETLKKLGTKLRGLATARPPFVNPPTGADARGVTWVRPELVAQVQFRDWTTEGVVRHTSFRGLREDLDPTTVVRQPSRTAEAETPAPKKPRVVKKTPAPAPPPSAALPRLTSPDRIAFPDRGGGYSLTKRQVAEYYEAVAPRMLPHVADRPLAILRCPDGEGGNCFFQKHPAKGMPTAVEGVEVPTDDGKSERHLVIRDAAGLLGLVQMNALEFHPWGAKAGTVETPDRLVFDLDPGPGVMWRQTVEGAVMVRDALAQLKLRGFARLSGGKGIHIVVPVKGDHTWEQAKAFSRAVAETLVKMAPRRFVATAGVHSREGRIFIDYLRNARGATAIAPYSTRARPGAPVALPVAWDELAGLESASAFSTAAVVRRLASGSPDPWEAMPSAAGTLPRRGR
ncbi:Multifunctional non-homologous end joining protein LigD [Phycisphaerales bacterium]|nr:Multifunctional non-homologous end joining protein LigD [Phycisphaerales bacterium]